MYWLAQVAAVALVEELLRRIQQQIGTMMLLDILAQVVLIQK